MNGESIFAMIILSFSGFGCGGVFWWIGHWSELRSDPMHFWSGSKVDPEAISDIPAYNRENARMWKLYSIPYWISGLAAIGTGWSDVFAVISLISITFACTYGIWWLIRSYRNIWNRYSIS